jgi:hypothetical protein
VLVLVAVWETVSLGTARSAAKTEPGSAG